jgi:hypothetical protein
MSHRQDESAFRWRKRPGGGSEKCRGGWLRFLLCLPEFHDRQSAVDSGFQVAIPTALPAPPKLRAGRGS